MPGLTVEHFQGAVVALGVCFAMPTLRRRLPEAKRPPSGFVERALPVDIFSVGAGEV